MRQYWRQVALTALVFSGWFVSSHAQITTASVRVDGLSCPFCAYGLEKKLKKVGGVSEVVINIAEGVADIQGDGEQSIGVDRLGSAVKNAGFTPREIRITASGNVARRNEQVIFRPSGSKLNFILQDNDQLVRLRRAIAGAARQVQVKGLLSVETAGKNDSSSLVLAVEEFEHIK